MSNLIQQGLTPATRRDLGLNVIDVAGNSVFLANSIKDGSKTGDLFMSADAGTNALLMGDANGDWVRWFAVFARNSVVIGYSPQSRFACSRLHHDASCNREPVRLVRFPLVCWLLVIDAVAEGIHMNYRTV